MATYPDVPGRRMAWDEDGTIVTYSTQGALGSPSASNGGLYYMPYVELSASALAGGNSESRTDWLIGTGQGSPTKLYTIFMFPEKREVDGIYINTKNTGTYWVYGSSDTTTGLDGSWSEMTTGGQSTSTTVDDFRDSIYSLALSNIRSIRMATNSTSYGSTQYIYMAHWYGRITPGETTDRLIFTDPLASDAEFTKLLDWVDSPQSQTRTRQIRVKNNSSTRTANSVTLSVEALTGTADTWYTFSLVDYGPWTSTLNIGGLGPGGAKSFYVKQTIPDAAAVGSYVSRIQALQGSWS